MPLKENMKTKKSFIFIVFMSFGFRLYSQWPAAEISFQQIFDNREYYSEFGFPQTIFGARIDASVLFGIDSLNHFAAGLNYMYEHGSSLFARPLQVDLYYRFEGQKLAMLFGSFQRKGRIDLPLIHLNDTLAYYRPNIEGALLSYTGRAGEATGFIDWTGRVTEQQRETFLAGFMSKLWLGKFFLAPTFLMYHNAKSYNPVDSIPIQDNGILSLLAGARYESPGGSWSLTGSTGFVSSYNRIRPGSFSWGRGILSDINFRYSVFGLEGVYYFGTSINFEYGDPFYRSGNYGRIDMYVDPFKNPNIDSKIGWNLHFLPGEGVFHSQQVLIFVRF